MRTYIIFVFALVLPLAILSILIYQKQIGNQLFAVLMLIYAFLYHPIVSAIRLMALNKLDRRKFWLALIPFWNWKYSGGAVFTFKG